MPLRLLWKEAIPQLEQNFELGSILAPQWVQSDITSAIAHL